MSKRMISAVLAAGMMAGAMPSAFAVGSFSDVKENHWAGSYISVMADRGIIDGYDDGSFMPEKNVTRAEFAKMLSGAAGLSEKTEGSFTDVNEGDWFAEYVKLIAPYLVGEGDMFKPQEGAKRKDVAAAIVRLCGIDASKSDAEALEKKFSDVSTLSAVDKQYIAAAVEMGVMDGFDEGVFKPEKCITRAQAAAIIGRTFDFTVVLTVGDEKVYNTDLINFTIDVMGSEKPEYKIQVVNDMATIFGAAQVAKAQGLELTDEDIQSVEATVAEFEEYGALSKPEFVRNLYTAFAYEDKLFEKYAERVDTSDEAVQKYFDENYYCAKHILVEDDALANDLLKKAIAGADFDKLMVENTTDPGSSTYTDGYVFTAGEMVPEFEDCVKSTQIGGFGLCKSGYGYHIINRLPLTFEAAGYENLKDQIKGEMLGNEFRFMLLKDLDVNGIEPVINWEAVEVAG